MSVNCRYRASLRDDIYSDIRIQSMTQIQRHTTTPSNHPT